MAGFLDDVYQRMPVFMQHVMVSTYGYRWKKLRFGGRFAEHCANLRAREHYTAQQWQDYTNQQLQALLVNALQFAPHYRETWGALGLTVEDMRHFTMADLPKLPPLEKSAARDNPHALLIGGTPQKRHREFLTSGSTGTPISTYWLPEELQH